jgi:hypothetical protein
VEKSPRCREPSRSLTEYEILENNRIHETFQKHH